MDQLVTYGMLHCSAARLWATLPFPFSIARHAHEQCHLRRLADEHPLGLRRAIDEKGGNLSTGQRQLCCLAFPCTLLSLLSPGWILGCQADREAATAAMVTTTGGAATAITDRHGTGAAPH